jgi:hypothetical protein
MRRLPHNGSEHTAGTLPPGTLPPGTLPRLGTPSLQAQVLIIASHIETCNEITALLPPGVESRFVRAASETEGLGAQVVVIGGEFPIPELSEVRVHPRLFDKPVVLFAPGKDLPALDWDSLSVWPVTLAAGAGHVLARYVRGLLADA